MHITILQYFIILYFSVSVLALDEFTDLKKKLEVEEMNRKTAEDVATEVRYSLFGAPCIMSCIICSIGLKPW